MINQEFEKIYKDTYDYLLKFIVIKCYNINDVNDIIQDTYIELYKIIKKNNKKIDNLESFVCGIATNIIKRHYNKKNKIKLLQNSDEEKDIFSKIPDDFDIEENLIIKDNCEKIWDYIETKDIYTIKIFYLYFRFDEKISDIAKELELNESNVKNKIYRTIKEIKNNFEKEESKNE